MVESQKSIKSSSKELFLAESGQSSKNGGANAPILITGKKISSSPIKVQEQDVAGQEAEEKLPHFINVQPTAIELQQQQEENSSEIRKGLDTLGRGDTSAIDIVTRGVTKENQEEDDNNNIAALGEDNFLGRTGPIRVQKLDEKSEDQKQTKEVTRKQSGKRNTVLQKNLKPISQQNVLKNSQLQSIVVAKTDSQASLLKFVGIAQNNSFSAEPKHDSIEKIIKPQIEIGKLTSSIEDGNILIGDDNMDMVSRAQSKNEEADEQVDNFQPIVQDQQQTQKNQKKLNAAAISQTMFSSYNDSDSNQTLRFNKNVSKLSLTTNKRAEKYGNTQERTELKKRVIQKPTQMELLIYKDHTPVVQDQPTRYHTLQGINLGDVGYGPIPIVNMLDETGYPIGEDELQIAQDKTETLKQAVINLTGDRNPLPVFSSQKKSPRGSEYSPRRSGNFGEAVGFGMGGLTQSPSAKKLLDMTHGAQTITNTDQPTQPTAKESFKFVVVQDGSLNPSIDEDKGRNHKSPFQSLSSGLQQISMKQPIVQIKKQKEKSAEKARKAIKRKHQSPPKYDIAVLPTHLNKTFSQEKLDAQQQEKFQTKYRNTVKKRMSKHGSKEKIQLLENEHNNQIITGPYSILTQNMINQAAQAETMLSGSGSDIPGISLDNTQVQRHQFGSKIDEIQYNSVALSPMMTGSGEPTQHKNMTGMFSNSSNNSQMIQSGMSSNFRKVLLKDVQSGARNSKIETFTSLYAPQKTYQRNGVQDILIGAQQDKMLLDQHEKRKYLTPMRQRPSENENSRLIMGTTARQNQRAASVSRESQFEPTAIPPIQTLEKAAEKNMFGKHPEPRKPDPKHVGFHSHLQNENMIRKKHSLKEAKSVDNSKKPNVPRSLYYSNGYVPKLSHLRDALRNNNIFHNRFNPEFETSEFKKTYAPAIKRSPAEPVGKIDEKFEDQNLLEILIPHHQKKVDLKMEKHVVEDNYQAVLHTRAQQEKTMDKLNNIKIQKHKKYEEIREKEVVDIQKKAIEFRARLNPFKNHDTAENIKTFLSLQNRNPKRNLLFDFMVEKKFKDEIIPPSMFLVEPERKARIERFIAEENKRMHQNDNDDQKFDRMKKQVEELVDEGFTFKQPQQAKKVNFMASQKKGQKDNQDSQDNKEGSIGKTMTMRRLTLSPSVSNISMKSSKTTRNRFLDPSIVDNDMELPQLTETRIRPALEFVPISARKPKVLKAVRKETVGEEKGQTTNQEEFTNHQDQPNSIVDYQKQRTDDGGSDAGKVLSSMSPAGYDLQHIYVNQKDSSVQDMVETQSIMMTLKDVQDLRKSKEQIQQSPSFLQTHANQLRKSKQQPLEFTTQEDGDLTDNNREEGKQYRASSASKKSLRESKSQIYVKGEVEITEEGEGGQIPDLKEDVRKSMVRDTSQILHATFSKDLIVANNEDGDQIQNINDPNGNDDMFNDRVLMNSNSAAINIGLGGNHNKKPFIGLSQQMSQNQFTIAPSTLTNISVGQGQARQQLLKEKRIEMLHKPDLNMSSCNHCITKAVKNHDRKMEQFTVQSTMAGQSIKPSTTTMYQAASEFLSVAPISESQNLAANFSMSQLPMTQFESQSNLQSEQIQKQIQQRLAKNAPLALKGILAQCDTHVKISKHTNEEFSSGFNKDFRSTQKEVTSINKAIHAILEARDQEYVPLWDDIRELQNLEQEANETVIADCVHQKQNVDVDAVIKVLKFERENAKPFQLSKFKVSPDIDKFLKRRFERSND